MLLCPKCHARFEAGTESCPKCRGPLIGLVRGESSGRAGRAANSGGFDEPSEGDEPLIRLLAEVPLPEVAGMIEEFLKSSGIECVTTTESIGLLYRLPMPLASSRIFVRESDYDEARELISHFFTSD